MRQLVVRQDRLDNIGLREYFLLAASVGPLLEQLELPGPGCRGGLSFVDVAQPAVPDFPPEPAGKPVLAVDTGDLVDFVVAFAHREMHGDDHGLSGHVPGLGEDHQAVGHGGGIEHGHGLGEETRQSLENIRREVVLVAQDFGGLALSHLQGQGFGADSLEDLGRGAHAQGLRRIERTSQEAVHGPAPGFRLALHPLADLAGLLQLGPLIQRPLVAPGPAVPHGPAHGVAHHAGDVRVAQPEIDAAFAQPEIDAAFAQPFPDHLQHAVPQALLGRVQLPAQDHLFGQHGQPFLGRAAAAVLGGQVQAVGLGQLAETLGPEVLEGLVQEGVQPGRVLAEQPAQAHVQALLVEPEGHRALRGTHRVGQHVDRAGAGIEHGLGRSAALGRVPAQMLRQGREVGHHLQRRGVLRRLLERGQDRAHGLQADAGALPGVRVQHRPGGALRRGLVQRGVRLAQLDQIRVSVYSLSCREWA
ncbi:hypothetical protein M7784_00780 [Desulfovibrio aminophilus]|nr:hypothetical protein [Desulfovibrio aminophilus]MCM0753784.1 hypothetical protein [Desulfovibrio aminophilus]